MEESEFGAIKCTKCGDGVFQFSLSIFDQVSTLDFKCRYCGAIIRISKDFKEDILIIDSY
jgi:ribosomal protein S27E